MLNVDKMLHTDKNVKYGQKCKIWTKMQITDKMQNVYNKVKYGQKGQMWTIM